MNESNTRRDGAQYGQGVADGGLRESHRELPKRSDRPQKSAEAEGRRIGAAPRGYVLGFRVRPLVWELAQMHLAAIWIPRGGYVGAAAVVVFP